MKNITFIIGHRGCGKSSLLSRLSAYYSSYSNEYSFFDLDGEVARGEGQGLLELWQSKGEKHFRALEKKYLKHLCQKVKKKAFIALGAGCDLKEIPEESSVLWLQREGDRRGRIFLDRPRLNPNLSPLGEFRERFFERQKRYAAKATEYLLLPEGLFKENPYERAFFHKKITQCGGILTLKSENFRTPFWPSFIASRKSWGLDFFELRSDLLHQELMEKAFLSLPKSKILLSFRKESLVPVSFLWKKIQAVALWDWDIELGVCPSKIVPSILSLHKRCKGEGIESCFEKLEMERQSEQQYLKLAVPVKNFKELEEAHAWACKEPHRRSFLPLSCSSLSSSLSSSSSSSLSLGLWQWYRLRMKGYYPLNFIKESCENDKVNPSDQPSLLQWLASDFKAKNFSAVLGHPICHSYSPMEQRAFFQSLGEGFFAIDMNKEEVNRAFLFLKRLGLHCAAVTSPLKKPISQFVSFQSKATLRNGSVNTLWVQDSTGKLYATNTDIYGWKFLLREVLKTFEEPKQFALWGGEALLETLLSGLSQVFPRAEVRCFSARTGAEKERRKGTSSPRTFQPSLVVWAAGGWWEGLTFPPNQWRPQGVVDLNYTEDSPARDYAQKLAIPYKSGHSMFVKQAAMQRSFWEKIPRISKNFEIKKE